MPDTRSSTGRPPADERRCSARLTLVTKAMLYPVRTPAAPRRVFLRNISYGGVAFRTAEPFEIGECYRLRVEAGPMQMATHVQIVSCTRHDDEAFNVSAAFTPGQLEFTSGTGTRRAGSIPRNPSTGLRPRAHVA